MTFCNQDIHNHVKEVWCSLPSLFVADIQGMNKIMATVVKATRFFIYMELGHFLPAIQHVSLEQTQVNSA